MARKKNRPQPTATEAIRTSHAGLAAPSALPGLSARTNGQSASAEAKPIAVKKPDQFWLAVWFRRLMRWLGSLQIAVFGLTLFGAVLAIGTIVESWYSGKLAQELVYRSWWFSLLIGLLGVNIFFAAAKKWPWKKHQAGFVITHIGLLMLVAGGILNAIGGTDSLLVALDGNAEMQRKHGATQVTHTMIDRDQAKIDVQLPAQEREKAVSVSFPFDPGSLPWRPDEYTRAWVDPLLSILNWLAHPLPRSWQTELPNNAQLEVLAFYPHVRPGRYRAAEKAATDGFPAIQFQLSSPMAGPLPEEWVALQIGEQVSDLGPGMVELLGTCPGVLLDEFLNPPPSSTVGPNGQLVFWLAGEKHHLAVDRCLEQAQPLGKTGWRVKAIRYVPDLLHPKEGDAPPFYPLVEFELQAPAGQATLCRSIARYAGPPMFEGQAPRELNGLQVWYHPPDYQYGRKGHAGSRDGMRALLQLVRGDGDRLYYRSFNTSRTGDFAVEKAGALDNVREPLNIWSGMNWKFRVTQWLPAAAREQALVPIDLRPGSEREGIVAALRCRLTKGDKKSEEFWLTQTDSSMKKVTLGGEQYQVGYHLKSEQLPFSIKLLRAEQTNDRSSSQAATYASFVQLTDKEQNIQDEDHVISMNAPLYHRGYKFYQSGYALMDIDPATEKPVSRSVFTVGYDPGIYLKYLGQIMLGVGIFTMFYMRAYFFKPRGPKAIAPAAQA